MEDHYPQNHIDLLEALWGEGFMSPGGPEEVARILGGHGIAGAAMLDIGCGAGGVDLTLVQNHGAGYVTGIDVEDPVLDRARQLVAAAGRTDRIGLAKVWPGPLPFPPETFDVVFSKDSIIHVADKHLLMEDVARVLKPGGRFLAADWLIGHNGEPSPEMQAYIAAEDVGQGMASPARYQDAMQAAGLVDVELISRNAWYRELAKQELERMQGPWRYELVGRLGEAFVAENITLWERMIPVLESGEHCPTFLRARKPAA